MYIPKNKIIPNLFTNGGEYIVESSQQEYSGFYHKTHTEEFYTGKTPNDSNVRKLIPIKTSLENYNTPVNQINLSSNNSIISEYLKSKNQNLQDKEEKKVPYFSSPSPTSEDYNLGVFTRYFLVKINELKFIEVNKEVYEKIDSQNLNWLFELYTPFKMLWTIRGDKEEVFRTNKNIVLVKEQKLNRKGLQQYLKEDYLKYYK
jgi:hypothetical protein